MDLHDYPQLWDTRQIDDSISFCPDSLVEPLLSLSVRLIFSDIVMIFGWSYSRCIGSHITILVEYMSDLLCIPMELFLSYQDRSGTSDAILGRVLPLAMEMIVLSQIFYSFHHSAERCCICFTGHYSCDFHRDEFRWSMTFRLWLSCYPWPRSRLFWWDRGSYPSGLFFWDSLVDYPFEMTMDSSNRAFRDRDIWLIVTSRQASWSRRMGCEAMFIVDLIILTR